MDNQSFRDLFLSSSRPQTVSADGHTALQSSETSSRTSIPSSTRNLPTPARAPRSGAGPKKASQEHRVPPPGGVWSNEANTLRPPLGIASNVSQVSGDDAGRQRDAGEDSAVEDELDRLADKETIALQRHAAPKRGMLAEKPQRPDKGRKRTRDELLAELKAARAAAKPKPPPSLGSRFRKIGQKLKTGTTIERDSMGRKVVVTVDDDGHVTRKLQDPVTRPSNAALDTAEATKRGSVLGLEVPPSVVLPEDIAPSDDDIFVGAGDDYDPLAGLASDTDEEPLTSNSVAPTAARTTPLEQPEVGAANATQLPRDYFKGAKAPLLSAAAPVSREEVGASVSAVLKRAAEAASSDRGGHGPSIGEGGKSRQSRALALQAASTRDDEDLDIGFGTSRFEDDDDIEDWREQPRANRRKRGPKKRKGDINSAVDVMRLVGEKRANE